MHLGVCVRNKRPKKIGEFRPAGAFGDGICADHGEQCLSTLDVALHGRRRNAGLRQLPDCLQALVRGGGPRFHGPGQLVVYPLFDLNRRSIKAKDFIGIFQDSILRSIKDYQSNLILNNDDPGIYYQNKKLVSFGLKITKKGTYHGASINVSMDLTPWNEVTICGNDQTEAIDLRKLGCNNSLNEIRQSIQNNLTENFK